MTASIQIGFKEQSEKNTYKSVYQYYIITKTPLI